MLRKSVWAAVVLGIAAPWGQGGPVDGPTAQKHRIQPAEGEPTPMEFTVTFRGGQRACVFVRGDHNPIVPLDITVFDKSGAIVAKDESAKDFLAVFWTPPRTAEYRIVLRNRGNEEFEKYPAHEKYTEVYVAFK